MDAVRDALKDEGVQDIDAQLSDAASSKVVDLEDTIHIHYVDRDRNLNTVSSLEKKVFSLNNQIRSAEEKKGGQYHSSRSPKER